MTLNPPDGSVDESQVLAKHFDSNSKLAVSAYTSRHMSHCKLNAAFAFHVDPDGLSAVVLKLVDSSFFTDSLTRSFTSTNVAR